MSEFRIYHVARNTAKHNYELDDRWYGSPLPKEGPEDWALAKPELYLKRVRAELNRIETAIDDLLYLLQEKGYKLEHPIVQVPSLEAANAHAFHRFHVRQFEYIEKLSQQLESKDPNMIDVIIPKAFRQLNVLLAAQEDLLVTQVRFSEYAMQKRQMEN